MRIYLILFGFGISLCYGLSEPPKITEHPADLIVTKNDPATLNCNAAGHPKPEITWIKNGKPLKLQPGRHMLLASGDLFFLTVLHNKKDDDTGIYWCVARNKYGKDVSRNATLEIAVLREEFREVPSDTRVAEGESVVLKCSPPIGHPEPVITWFKDNTELDPATNHRFKIMDQGNLLISNVRVSDTGDYECMAKNVQGTRKTPKAHLTALDLKMTDTGVYTCDAVSESGNTIWRTALIVDLPNNPNAIFYRMPSDTYLPEPPSQVTVLWVNSTQVTLGWKRSRSGSSSLMNYLVQLWSPDIRGAWSTPNTERVAASMPVSTAVVDLMPDTRYMFVVRSSNSHGLSRPSAVTQTVRTLAIDEKETLPLHEVRQRLSSASIKLKTVEAVTSTTLKVTWQLMIDSKKLEGIYIRYYLKQNPKQAFKEDVVYFHLHHSRNSPKTHEIHHLQPSKTYEVFIVPFYKSVEGFPSSVMHGTTLETPLDEFPKGLHYTLMNHTTIRVTWDPLEVKNAHSHIISYMIQVSDITHDVRLHFNRTINNTWTTVENLSPGSRYQIFVRGVTPLGLGPQSKPLAFNVPKIQVPVHPPTVPHPPPLVPITPVSPNTYLIIGILSGAIVTFACLSAVIFIIYRKRQPVKSPTYFSKAVDGTGPWVEHPGCWTDGSMNGIISNGTFYKDKSPLSHLYSQCSLLATIDKSSQDADPRMPENLYEDPDGLKMVSFNSQKEKRASLEPYATTPLISTESYRSTTDSVRRLPPNIPLTSRSSSGLSESSMFAKNITKYNKSMPTTDFEEKNSVNSNGSKTHSKNRSLGVPVLQFPGPPTEDPDSNTINSADGNQAFMRQYFSQVPAIDPAHVTYDARLNSDYPKMSSDQSFSTSFKKSTDSFTPLNRQNSSPKPVSYDSYNRVQTNFPDVLQKLNEDFKNSEMFTQVNAKDFEQALYQEQYNDNSFWQDQQFLMKQRDIAEFLKKYDNKDGLPPSESEWYAQPTINQSQSERSSSLGGPDSDTEYSTRESCGSLRRPQSHGEGSHVWANEVKGSKESTNRIRGGSVCSTDDSTYFTQSPKPLRLSGKKKTKSKSQSLNQKIPSEGNVHSEFI